MKTSLYSERTGKMKTFILDIEHYEINSGYSYTETFDSGTLQNDEWETYTAGDWVKAFNDNESEDENKFINGRGDWLCFRMMVYDGNADPMFDDPIRTSEYWIEP